MNNGEIIGKVHNSMYRRIQQSGTVAPVQILIDLGILSAADYERWRFGNLDYLERVCKVNLHKLAFIMQEVRAYALKNDLKASWTFYRQWGRKGKTPAVNLRFSKYGSEDVERDYATHYISERRMAELKQSAAADGENE
jgi:hypothetical protein